MVSKNVWLLSLASFFTDTATAMVVSVLPVFVVHHLGASYTELGLIVGLATFVSYLFRVLFGFFSDRFGVSKPFLLLGYSISALVKPLFAFAEDWKSVAFLRSIDRLGKAVRSAPRDRLLSLSGKRQGKIFGLHKSFDVAGETLGALTAFALLLFLGQNGETYRLLFLLSLIPGFLALLSLLPVKEVKTTPKKEFFKISPADRRLFPFLMWMASVVLFVWPLPVMLALVKEGGISEAQVPLFYLLANGLQVIFGYPVGLLIDRYSFRVSLLLSLLFAGVSLLFLSEGLFLLAFPFFGLFQVFHFTLFRSFIGKKATHKGSVYGIFYTLYGILGLAGASLIGFLISRFGLEVALIYSLLGLSLVGLLTSVRFKV